VAAFVKTLMKSLMRVALACVTVVLPAVAADPNTSTDREKVDLTQIDKSGYHLLNPTPARYLREMTTDRPDKTESPYTVDAGHFQIEMDLVNNTRDRDTSGGADTRVNAWPSPRSISRSALQSRRFPDGHRNLQFHHGGRPGCRHEAPPVRLRRRHQPAQDEFLGNDGGPTAFGVMPFVKFPTSQARPRQQLRRGRDHLPAGRGTARGFRDGHDDRV